LLEYRGIWGLDWTLGGILHTSVHSFHWISELPGTIITKRLTFPTFVPLGLQVEQKHKTYSNLYSEMRCKLAEIRKTTTLEDIH